MKVYWQDQAEWYYVCDDCFNKEESEGRPPWSGSTEVWDWPRQYKDVMNGLKHAHKCEWCGKEEHA